MSHVTCYMTPISGPLIHNLNESLFISFSHATAKLVYAIICIVGLIGNSLVIYVVLRFSKMKTVTNMYILNLAFADEMFLVGLPFLIVTLIFKHWIFGNLMCKIYMTISFLTQFTSSMLLTVMSADRFVAVVHPVSHKSKMRKKKPVVRLYVSVFLLLSQFGPRFS